MFQKNTQVKFVDVISDDGIVTAIVANKDDVQKYLYTFAMDRWEDVFGTMDNVPASRKAIVERFYNAGTYTFNTGTCTVMSRAGLQKRAATYDGKLRKTVKK